VQCTVDTVYITFVLLYEDWLALSENNESGQGVEANEILYNGRPAGFLDIIKWWLISNSTPKDQANDFFCWGIDTYWGFMYLKCVLANTAWFHWGLFLRSSKSCCCSWMVSDFIAHLSVSEWSTCHFNLCQFFDTHFQWHFRLWNFIWHSAMCIFV